MSLLFRQILALIIVALFVQTGFANDFKGVDPANLPKVVEFIPANGSSVVAAGIKELKIKFNVDMKTDSFSVVTPCGDSGVCYKNGFWQDKRTLVIRVSGKLKANHKYELGVGTKKVMYSAEGLHLEPIWWRFDTL